MASTLGTLGRHLLRGVNAALPSSTGGVTVLAYHLVGGGTGSPVDLDRGVFERQLDELAQLARVVSLERAIELLERGEVTTGNLAVLTFDDAYGNFFETAWPLLRARRLPATLYVPVGFLEGQRPGPLSGDGGLDPMAWGQLAELAASGLVSIGSHSLSHPDLRSLSTEDCRWELAESRRVLEEKTDRAVRSFCYPRGLLSRAVKRLTADVYESAVAAGGVTNRPGNFDRYRISRVPLRSDMPESLGAVVRKPIWLEEWVASRTRRLRQSGGHR